MKINLDIPKNQQFRAFYMFFIIIGAIIGVDMIGTPEIIFLKAAHDSWISIILAYFYILLLIFTMLYILRQYENADILGIQTDLFGSFISKAIGIVYIVFFASQILATLLIYIEIIQAFIFPESNSFVLGFMLLSLIVYSLLGGLRVVIGVVFVFIVLSSWLLLLLIQPAMQMEFLNFLPIFDEGIPAILDGVQATAFTFTGIEVLFFLYPFVQDKDKIGKPLFWGFTSTAFFILLLTVISIGFLSAPQLERRIWVVLNLYKLQTTPIIERLDYIVVAEWMMVTVPRVILIMWCVIYILKRMYQIPKKYSVYGLAILLLCIIPFFDQHFEIQNLIESSRIVAIRLVYIYPFLLLPLVLFKKSRKNKEN